jgi:hypothetical protein
LTRTQRQIVEFRQGDGCIQVRDATGQPCAGIPISIEQESHEFPFGCIVPHLSSFAEPERDCYQARLGELFNCVTLFGTPPSADIILRVEIAERTPLGRLRLRLDELAVSGRSLQAHIWGTAVGLSEAAPGDPNDREAGKRVAELYPLCFAHPAVTGIFWNGFKDGEPGVHGSGLLRRDFAPKYAFKVLQKLVGFDWHSRAKGHTDAAGQFQFRGFFGAYRVVAHRGEGDPLVEIITLRGGGDPFILRS